MGLQWAAQGSLVRLFMLYLMVAVCISLMRTIRLIWRLHSFLGRRKITFEDICVGAVSGETLGQSALSNKIASLSPAPQEARQRPTTAKHSNPQYELSNTLQLADTRFDYLWHMCGADVWSIRRSMRLLLLVSAALLVWNLFPTWQSEFNNSKITSPSALTRALELDFAWLGFTLFVCSFLYATYSRFEVTMLRRRASWEYLRATLETPGLAK